MHTKRFREVPPPENLEEAIKLVLNKYPKVENILSDDLEMEVRESLKAVKRDSSPGVPWLSLAPTNELLLATHEELVVRATVERLELLLAIEPHDLRKLSAEELVQQGYCDPVRVFVKQEPHTMQKVQGRRFRLICSVSIVDQLVERILAWRQNNHEIDNWESIPSKPGIGFTDEMCRSVWDQVNPLLSRNLLVEMDMGSWDWTLQGWFLDADARMRVELGACPRMARLILNRFRCIAMTVYCLSNGRMFAQVLPGGMLSGSYITSSTNSRARVLAAQIVGADAIAMGDDSLESWVEDAPAKYEKLGFIVRMHKRCNGSFEFCSQHYEAGTAYPVSWPKTFFRLLNQRTPGLEERAALLVQFITEMRHHPRLQEFTDWLSEIGWLSEKFSDGN